MKWCGRLITLLNFVLLRSDSDRKKRSQHYDGTLNDKMLKHSCCVLRKIENKNEEHILFKYNFRSITYGKILSYR